MQQVLSEQLFRIAIQDANGRHWATVDTQASVGAWVARILPEILKVNGGLVYYPQIVDFRPWPS